MSRMRQSPKQNQRNPPKPVLETAVRQNKGSIGFELGRYHESVHSHGSLPAKYFPELVQAQLRK